MLPDGTRGSRGPGQGCSRFWVGVQGLSGRVMGVDGGAGSELWGRRWLRRWFEGGTAEEGLPERARGRWGVGVGAAARPQARDSGSVRPFAHRAFARRLSPVLVPRPRGGPSMFFMRMFTVSSYKKIHPDRPEPAEQRGRKRRRAWGPEARPTRLALLSDTSRSLPGPTRASSARLRGVLAPSLRPLPYGLRRASLSEQEV